MEVAVIGTGYVGLVTGACLAEKGHRVHCIDIDESRVQQLNNAISPIYEEGIEELLKNGIKRDNLFFTTDYEEGLHQKDIVFLAVGTPESEDGSADLSYLYKASETMAHYINRDITVVIKSTVPVGTGEQIDEKLNSIVKPGVNIRMASNPEFLRQGTAVYDTFHADRIIVGANHPEAKKQLEELYHSFHLPIVVTDIKSAEMIKYTANSFLAMKISFINEIANLSEKLGANIESVTEGIGMDKRIGSSFLNAGIGFGGSCFPKDTKAMVHIAESVEMPLSLIEEVIKVNEKQREVLVDKVRSRFKSLEGLEVAVLGLSFKPNTDDMREAASISIIRKLVQEGVKVTAFDPVAMERAKQVLPEQVNYTDSLEEAIKEKDATLIVTEWNQIKDFPLEKYVELMATPIIMDGRNCFEMKEVQKYEIEYHSIGRKTINNLS
ncbi:UDP-glucose 6-dehydrogenase [Oceanobacillus sp. E9]|uniref:UDP-glucose 6-dehydrogenase n=1 Tax=Oceanobacillus kimchii TaxID=746691 RepID=A0ABQ5TLA6_9BACI|nr:MULTISPECIES: UDP-glucose/GDP-mannose dehydrogenase family protein [Oceanobacillus]MBT2599394.1 UDP-glucose/GDP-mannose dehydrogenase family protein [Oceanobacillus sp. ISL-74]OEH55951.1 UDP-glucose 6-dehydrogenase [Oceanobacillus sp. E9]GLO67614.1 UDP-glucose 6-dehydrogenase YwqF [Oceanobacillus kimchii]